MSSEQEDSQQTEATEEPQSATEEPQSATEEPQSATEESQSASQEVTESVVSEPLSLPTRSSVDESEDEEETPDTSVTPKGSCPYENEIQRQIIAVFYYYDRERTGVVSVGDMKVIIRSLVLCVNGKELEGILSEIVKEDSPDSVALLDALPVLTKIFLEGRFTSADKDTLQEAFETIDPAGRGYITREEFEDLFAYSGESLDHEELERMFNAGKDEEKNFNYRSYCEKITFPLEHTWK